MIKKRIPAHTIEIRKYVCTGCGLGMECGNPGSGATHRYIRGHGEEWDCGPVVEIPAFPKYVRVQGTGSTPNPFYFYSMNKKGERIRKLDKLFARWENVEKMLRERENKFANEHVCSTGECYPVCKKTGKRQ